MKKKIATALCFCICLIIALSLISRVLSYKYPEGIGAWKEYYAEKSDIDVMMFGSSHILRQINPAILYNEDGIASYALATGGEAIWTTYYSMEEALKYQKPQVALVDVYMIFRGDLYDDTHNVTGTFGKRRSLTWLKEIRSCVPENKIYYMTRYPLYHTRYKSLTKDDFKSSRELYKDIIKGFLLDEHHWKTNEMPDLSGMMSSDAESGEELPERSRVYLDKIVSLAREKNIKLVFLQTPFYCSEETAAKFNVLNQYVDDQNVFYWDCNRDVPAMQLDNMTDFRDDNHLNWRGSQKLSKYLAGRLADEFALEDHRGQEAYATYEEEYLYYRNLVTEFEAGI